MMRAVKLGTMFSMLMFTLGVAFSAVAGDVLVTQVTELENEVSPPMLVIAPPTEEAETNAEPVSEEAEQSLIEGERNFTVYVIRHAEKEDSDLDPGLTRDGYRRADGLAQLLQKAGVDAIYSTYYRRNVGTALPLARVLSVPIQFYHEDNADELIERVLSRGETTVVVGHSNTVPDLIRAFGGQAEDMAEEDYGDLFQLNIDVKDEQHQVRQVNLQAPLLISDK